MSTDIARIGLLGRGTVGAAFHDLVAARAGAIAAVAGRRPEIVGVLRRDEGDFDRILSDSEIVVELMGGTDPARDYVLRALEAGRHVVTANKQLIAQFGDELFDAARGAGVQLRFEAAVAGVVPVIRVIQESLAATEITKVFGIVNGTTNFILSEMASTGSSYADALGRPPELGYAGARPPDDVGGHAAAGHHRAPDVGTRRGRRCDRLRGARRRLLDPLRQDRGACGERVARDRPRHQLLLLPAPGGRRQSRRPRPDRRRARPERGLGAE